MAFIIILVAMLVLMYFLLIRPQRAQQRKAQDMLSALKPGDEIITVGGIYADVVEVEDDKVVLEIAEDVHIEVARKAIANIVPPEVEEPDEDEDEVESDDGEPEADAADELEPAAESEPAPDETQDEKVEERTR